MEMNTKKKALCFIMIASLIATLPIKSGLGATGSFYPTDSNDDGFITQVGNHFRDTPYLPLRSATTDVIDGIRFRTLNIPQDAKINNATLFVRTLHTYDPGLVLVTIYGVDENDAYAFNSSGDFTRPYTSSNVVWNVSEVNGNTWHNVSVTNIVQEIISRYGWRTGNSLAFIILADSGEPRREFASIDNNIIYRPRLEIYWDVDPTDETVEDIQEQATPPYNDTDDWTFELNGTYQGIDIYIATEANWLNFSTFAVMGGDSGKITGLNDTWFQVTNMFTDSDCYVRRDYEEYRDNTSDTIGVKFGLKWEGMPWQGPANYDYVNMWGISTEHGFAQSFGEGYSYEERTWADQAMGTAWSITGSLISDSLTWSPLFLETGLPFTLYYYIRLDMSIMQSQVWTYNDIDMTDLNTTYLEVFTSGPDHPPNLLYEYLIAPAIPAGPNTGFTGEYLSKGLDDLNQFIFLVYPNGTLVITDPLPEGTDPEDYIDDLVGVDPEDPQTDEYGEALTKNRWKTFVFIIGMVMFLGTPTFAMMARVSIGRWIMVLFISLCGLSILWSIIYM